MGGDQAAGEQVLAHLLKPGDSHRDIIGVPNCTLQLNVDLYDTIAAFYRIEMEGYEEDIPFYLNLAGRTGGPVLDVGTGTGRIAAALAKHGHEGTGLDSSEAMLKHAAGFPTVLADMRDMDLQARFGLIVVAAGTFAHLTTRSDQERALRAFHKHLTPNGILAIALQNPYQWALDDADDELLFGWEREETRMTYSVSSDRALQLRHVRNWYDVTGKDGTVKRTSVQFFLRWTYQPELELLLERCGLKPEAWYGSYDLDPYNAESPALIALASRQ